jgi:protein transport protein SEC24
VSPSTYDQTKPVYEIELVENGDTVRINGISEYGYGFWMKWSRTGPGKSLVSKAPWYNIARLTINKGYGDASALGDRTLAAWVGTQIYHFCTYDVPSNNVNVCNNINYGNELDGVWEFLYFSYKKTSATGNVVGFIKMSDTVQTISGAVTHTLLQNYLYFSVGKDNYYPGYNGYYT